MYLADFTAIAEACRESGGGFRAFRRADRVLDLRWPADVSEQWLYDHSNNGPFLQDYGDVDLSQIHWGLEALRAVDIAAMPTGPSDHEIIDEFAANPDHLISVRNSGVHIGVAQMWELHGTWKRWPVLIDRRLLGPPGDVLQVVEGRTRGRNPQGPPQAWRVRCGAAPGMGRPLPCLTTMCFVSVIADIGTPIDGAGSCRGFRVN